MHLLLYIIDVVVGFLISAAQFLSDLVSHVLTPLDKKTAHRRYTSKTIVVSEKKMATILMHVY